MPLSFVFISFVSLLSLIAYFPLSHSPTSSKLLHSSSHLPLIQFLKTGIMVHLLRHDNLLQILALLVTITMLATTSHAMVEAPMHYECIVGHDAKKETCCGVIKELKHMETFGQNACKATDTCSQSQRRTLPTCSKIHPQKGRKVFTCAPPGSDAIHVCCGTDKGEERKKTVTSVNEVKE